MEIVCPICNGRGMVCQGKPKTLEYKRKMVKRLKENGCTVRQIMRIMGYKSPRSVQDILDWDLK